MIFDTHSHCYWDSLSPQMTDLIARMKDAGVVHAVQIGCDVKTSKKAIQLAVQFPDTFFASVGLHPETAQHEAGYRAFFQNKGYDMSDFDAFLDAINAEGPGFWDQVFDGIDILTEFEALIHTHKKHVVAIGECGLDFHYLDGTDGGKNPIDWNSLSSVAKKQIEHQKFWWLAQWKLAQKYHMPVIIHTRDARDATVAYMARYNISYAVMHCYAENPDMAQALMDISDHIYFSFSGIVTYKKAPDVQATAAMLPLSKILVETDAPFLAPVPVRGKTCEPAFTRHTLDYICALRQEPREEIEEAVYQNSLRFFGIAK